MADQASDFMRQSQAMAQQAWEQWMRQLQQSAAPAASVPPFGGLGFGSGHGFAAHPTSPSMQDLLERTLGGVKGYADWLQRAAGAQVDPAGADWQERMQQWFGQANQPFAQAFNGIDSTAAQGFVQQWQAWLAASGAGVPGDWKAGLHMPAFGLQREQQEQQQALAAAMIESLEQQRKYQALLERANAKGLELLQDKLAQHAEPGREIESLKTLYDLWIDSAEEAYAEIALSDEFREVYGAMVNAQMRERELQQRQLEAWCRQLGLPTRSEVDSIGRRLQEVRRELRAGRRASDSDEVTSLRAEVAALKKQLAAKPAVSASAEPASTEAAARAGVARRKTPARRAVAASGKPKTSSKPTKRAKAPVRSAASRKKAASASRTESAAKPPVAASASPVKAKDKQEGKAGKGRAVGRKSAAPSRSKAARASSAAVEKAAVRPGFPAPRRAKRK